MEKSIKLKILSLALEYRQYYLKILKIRIWINALSIKGKVGGRVSLFGESLCILHVPI